MQLRLAEMALPPADGHRTACKKCHSLRSVCSEWSPHLQKDEGPGCHRQTPGLIFQCANPPLSWGGAWNPGASEVSSISHSSALGCPLPRMALPQHGWCGAHFTTPLPTGLDAADTRGMIPHSKHRGKHGCPCHPQCLLWHLERREDSEHPC